MADAFRPWTKEEEQALYLFSSGEITFAALREALRRPDDDEHDLDERIYFLRDLAAMEKRSRAWRPEFENAKSASETPQSSKPTADELRETILMAGYALLRAAKDADEKGLQTLIEKGVPVNFQETTTGATALHYTAAYAARPAFRVLMASSACDFLIRDRKGRLASEMAGVFGDDPAMARLLRIKERKQAQGQGIVLTRRLRKEGS
jgi:ankyrin repeat protein